jgi:hypothetical protein
MFKLLIITLSLTLQGCFIFNSKDQQTATDQTAAVDESQPTTAPEAPKDDQPQASSGKRSASGGGAITAKAGDGDQVYQVCAPMSSPNNLCKYKYFDYNPSFKTRGCPAGFVQVKTRKSPQASSASCR